MVASPQKPRSFSLRIWVAILVTDAVVIAGILYFLLTGRQKFRALFSDTWPFLPMWLILAVVVFIGVAAILAYRQAKKPREELEQLSRELGVRFTPRWGMSGGAGSFSVFGYGPYFEGTYQGLSLAYSPIIEESGAASGLRLFVPHPRPLGLGLFLKYGLSTWASGRMPGEYRDIMAKELPAPPIGSKVYARKTPLAAGILTSEKILNELTNLKSEFDRLRDTLESRADKGQTGFVITDRGSTAFLPLDTPILKSLVDRLCILNQALAGSELLPSSTGPSLDRRIYHVVIGVLIVMIALSLICNIFGRLGWQ